MDFRLRPGETLVRSTEGQGRFHVPQAWIQMKEKFGREWKGFPVERYEPFRRYGNGRWIYGPELTEKSGDFRAGLWEPSGLEQDAAGLVGPGSATWRVLSPYPFCGVPALSGEELTHSDGVWLELAGSGPVRAEVTDAEGNWVEAFSAAGDFDERTDITRLLCSRYGCLIRVSLGEAALLRRFRFEGFLMTAPLSIPRLVAGDNAMEVRSGDKHGLCTVPWSETIDFRAGADLSAQWHAAENAEVRDYLEGWRRIGQAGNGPVSVVFRFDAPAGGRFAWAYAHVSLNEGPPEQPPGKAKLQWSADGSGWHGLSEIEIANTPRQWDCSIDGEVRFADPLRGVYLRITSDTAVSGFEFHGHLAQAAAAGETLRITHRWREGDAERTFQPPAGASKYVIHCGKDPEGHTIEMHVPSIGREKPCGPRPAGVGPVAG